MAQPKRGGLVLLDLHCFKPPDELAVSMDDVHIAWNEKRKHDKEASIFAQSQKKDQQRNGTTHTAEGDDGSDDASAQSDQEAQDIIDFQYRVWQKAGLGDNRTYLPKSIHPKFCGNNPKTDLDSAAEECRMAVCGAVEGLLNKAGMAPQDIDILITTCSIYCPTPSMAAMVVNAFGMRPDVQSYHLGGMGCANGVVAINLVADLLKAHPNSNAVLVTTETTTPAFYRGRDKHRLVTNVLFRMGAAAILLTNKPSLQRRAKYTLDRRYRVNNAAREEAYRCIWYGPDDQGLNGTYLGLNVVKEASRALTVAITKVGRYVLNWQQILAYLDNQFRRKVLKQQGLAPFVPCFADCIEHFLIHAGGAKVLDGLGKELKLGEEQLRPSRTVLYDYGNVSSSTTWYTLACIESTKGIKAGERIMQIGVGSGVKAGVNVWRALRDVRDVHEAWAHRVPPEERAGVVAARGVDARHGLLHVGLRLLSLALLALLLAVLAHALGLGGMVAAAVSSSSSPHATG